MSDKVYGLSTIWVNPYQARISTVEEAVRQLTTLISSGPNWPYTLVWLNGDTCHLSIQPEGGTSSATCRMVGQLEVHWLLSSGSQVIYPVGLNGVWGPMIASPPRSLAQGTNLLGGEPIYLKVGTPQSTVGGQNWRCHPLAITPPSWLPAPSRLHCQRPKERSAWPWKWGSSYPRWY